MKKYSIVLLAVGLAIITSCTEKLNLAPENAITEEQIKEILASGNSDKIELILGGIANTIESKIHQFVDNQASADGQVNYVLAHGHMFNLFGNDMVIGDGSYNYWGVPQYQFENAVATGSSENRCWWDHGYSCVVQGNKLLNYLDDATVGDNARLKEYKARALVLRAWGYHYVMQVYQDAYLQGGNAKLGLSLYDRYDPGQPFQPRSSSQETYNFIKNDLNTAIQLFEEAGVGYTEKVNDLDAGVANFLLARVSLWTGDWPTTIAACNDVLSHYPDLISEKNYGGKNTGTPEDAEFLAETNAFLNNAVNPEVILGFPKGFVSGNTVYSMWMNIFATGWGGQMRGYARIDDRLYNLIPDNDYRKSAFCGETPFGDYSYPGDQIITVMSYVNLKFAATQALNGTKEQVGQNDFYYMRSSEVLLMKAEAQLQAGDEAGAKATVNTLLAARTKAGETPLTIDTYPASAGKSTLEKIQLQWRIEMWGENGLEFYNNKRWGITVDRSGSVIHWYKAKTLSPSQMTLQIPENERLYNPLCVPN
ncbi:MAG: RagB/SusD family nutrient uptake outer membrane protein [Tannerella sp.]|jgi:hypothetical protein|nr:RagB/SusD family nutrient uptake outer membrane protein [Tannerella sp.]